MMYQSFQSFVICRTFQKYGVSVFRNYKNILVQESIPDDGEVALDPVQHLLVSVVRLDSAAYNKFTSAYLRQFMYQTGLFIGLWCGP